MTVVTPIVIIRSNVFLDSFPVVATGMEIYRRNCTELHRKVNNEKRGRDTSFIGSFRVVSCVCVHQSLLGMCVCVCVCVSHYCNDREGYMYYFYHFASFFLPRTYQLTHKQTDIQQEEKGGEHIRKC